MSWYFLVRPLGFEPRTCGAYCSMCGVLPPIFTCGYCWCRQVLMVQGASPPATQAFGPGQGIAAVVQAPAGATPATAKVALAEFLKNFAGELGKGMGQSVSGSFQ